MPMPTKEKDVRQYQTERESMPVAEFSGTSQLTFGAIYARLYRNDIIRAEYVNGPTSRLDTVRFWANLLLGSTLCKICFCEMNDKNPPTINQLQRRSTALRDGRVLTSHPIRALKRESVGSETRRRICREVRIGSNRFMREYLCENGENMLRKSLSNLLDELDEAGWRDTDTITSLRREMSAENLLSRLLLLSVIGCDEGWDQVGVPAVPDEHMQPVLMAPLSRGESTYQWDLLTEEAPLVQLWRNRGTSKYFQLIGFGQTTAGGVGKTTALKSLAQAELANEDILLVRLKDAYAKPNCDEETRGNQLLTYIWKECPATASRGMLDSFTFLLDGFNELSWENRQQFCHDIFELCDKKASLIVTSRTDIRCAMDQRSYAVHQEFWDKMEKIMIHPLNANQKERFYQKSVGAYPEKNDLLDVVRNSQLEDSPFYLSLCCGCGPIAEEWCPRCSGEPIYDGDGSIKVKLMLYYVLSQIRSAGEGIKAEQTGFLMTKVLPLAAYQKVWESTWQAELRQSSSVSWDDDYIQDCITHMQSIFCVSGRLEDLSEILALFPEGQGLSQKRTDPGRKISAIQYALQELSREGLPYGNAAALTRNEYDVGTRWDFTHDNTRDFLAALHVCNVLTLLYNGYQIREDTMENDIEIFAVRVSWWDNSILELVYHLALRYIPGFDLEINPPAELPTKERVIFAHIMSWLCRCGRALAEGTNMNGCKRAYDRWNRILIGAFEQLKDFDADRIVSQRYIQSYIFALCERSTYLRGLAVNNRDASLFRENLQTAFKYARKARDIHENPIYWDIPLADGYQYLAQCKNVGFEEVLNCKRTWNQVCFLLEETDIKYADTLLRNVERLLEISSQGEDIIKCWAKHCGYRINVIGWSQWLGRLANGMVQILRRAKQLMANSKGELHDIYALGYAAKALTIRAAIGTSGAALNGLGAMMQYQRCVQECHERLAYFKNDATLRPLTEKDAAYMDGDWNAYLFYQAIQQIQRGSQSYATCRMAELILRRRIGLADDGRIIPIEGCDQRSGRFEKEQPQMIIEALLRDAQANSVRMSSFWYGRYCEERAEAMQDQKQRDIWLNRAEQAFETEVRRATGTSVSQQIEIIRESIDGKNQFDMSKEPVMRTLIEWRRVRLIRGHSCNIHGVDKYFEALNKRLDNPIWILKEGFIPTKEEAEEIKKRYCFSKYI